MPSIRLNIQYRDVRKYLLILLNSCVFIFIHTVRSQTLADPVIHGYRDHNYGEAVTSTPTGEKPESKLWWNDGSWWGSLWDPSTDRYTIHRLNRDAMGWENTAIAIDDRHGSKADVLWDGEKLYIASHIFTKQPGPATDANAARLYRYSYRKGNNRYILDEEFPVRINSSTSETLVLDKESTGKLWITWVEQGKVKMNCSTTNDRTWEEPWNLPAQGSDVGFDDISSLVAFDDGNKIGVMWSNQIDEKTYFVVHKDGNSKQQWEAREEALSNAELGAVADDHINMKAAFDGSGDIYAITKTGLTASTDPLILLLKRDSTGTWTQSTFGTVQDKHTRPILLIDEDLGQARVFATSDASGSNIIYEKSADLADLSFAPGLGTSVIESDTDREINNVTSTKQAVNQASGILILASDKGTHYYFHNSISPINSLDKRDQLVDKFTMYPNYPNPFNPVTVLKFEIKPSFSGLANARLTIYDLSGRPVKTLLQEKLTPGIFEVEWNGTTEMGGPASSGIYFARLTVDRVSLTRKLTLTR